jgi:N-acetylglutamate synthase-like GNAT family acetyltransferase
MIIRKATVADCARCEELCDTPELLTAEKEVISQAYLEEHVIGNSIFLVAENHKIEGFILGEALKGSNVLLHFLVVDGEVRGKGIGTQLLEAFIGECKKQNANYVFLYAPNLGKTPEFYRKNGFTEGKNHIAFSLKI